MATWTVHQSIVIHQMKIGAVSNSSVIQIGTAGSVRSLSNLYNTGGFTGPAPELGKTVQEGAISAMPLVPLPAPST
ncbi:spore germination protein GerPB [Paenibacillus puerhi]|uniref:spore germination protein GerPB n=1 Tax=Paenibacillus puerhi TaxID=2692622 RepID=UPI00135A1D82|nr:spore germination protein GerPB [Paenibacillus puerhi]